MWGRRPGTVVILYLLITLFCALAATTGLGGPSLFDRLHTGQNTYPGSDSYIAEKIIAAEKGSEYQIITTVKVPNLARNTAEISRLMRPVHHDLLKTKGIKTIVDPFVVFDPRLPEGKKAEEEIQKATIEAEKQAAATASKKAQTLGANPQQLSEASATAKLKARQQVRKSLPPPLEVIQKSQLKQLFNADKNSFLIVVTIAGKNQHYATNEETRKRVENILQEIPDYFYPLTKVSSAVNDDDLLRDGINKQIKDDLEVGEGVSLPLALIIMAFAFSGLLAAILPLLGAGITIAIALFILLILSTQVELQSFVVNVVTFLALGLSIDYGLLIVSRYREELSCLSPTPVANRTYFFPRPMQRLLLNHTKQTAPNYSYQDLNKDKIPPTFSHPKLQAEPVLLERSTYQRLLTNSRRPYLSALIKTMNSAGMTVLFSAVIVALAIAGLMIFPQPILRDMGIGGLTAVMLALLINWTLLPSLLIILGPFLLKTKYSRRIPLGPVGKLYDWQQHRKVSPKPSLPIRCALFSSRHCWPVLLVTCGVLLGFATMTTGMHTRFSWIEALPKEIQQIRIIENMWKTFPHTEPANITIVADTNSDTLKKWADNKIANLSDVDEVKNLETFKNGKLKNCGEKICPQAQAAISVIAKDPDSASPVNQNLVQSLRKLPANFDFWITGPTAIQLDFGLALSEYAPYVLGFIILTTMLMITLMTKSLVLPLQAVIVNSLSLLSSLGIATLIFQYGWGESYLSFTSLGALESYVIAIVLCFGFGLSMDYEMFLLSRVQEVWKQTQDNRRAVDEGMTGSASIITSAALILLVVFTGFATSDMLAIKQIGLTLAIAVAIDATVIRLFLVPSLMVAFGKLNWWCPRPLFRFLEKIEIADKN